MNKKALSPYIRRATYSTVKAPFSINERIIFDYEIILVSGGACKFSINDKDYIIKKNDVIFIRPGVRHKFEGIEGRSFSQPHIHFDPVFDDKSEERYISFKSTDKMTDSELLLISDDVFYDVEIPEVFVPYNMEKFSGVFMEIIEIFQKKEYNYEIKYKVKMLELIALILEQFEVKKASEYEALDDIIVSVKNYIDSNYLSLITLDFLSRHFYINKYTLLRKFAKMYNKNPIEYYREKRIDYAKKMLISTNLSVGEIGEKLNFSDIYSFSRFFKSHTGISPTAYKK